MVLLKAGIGIAILAAIIYGLKKKQKQKQEFAELLKIEEEFLADLAKHAEQEGHVYTLRDIEEEPSDDNWEPMMLGPDESFYKCDGCNGDCECCHHEEEEHECCGGCNSCNEDCGCCHHEEEHECCRECENCNHCEMDMIEEDNETNVIADRIVFVNDGTSSSNKYHKAADSHGMDGAIKMSETEALEKGYVPCARCFGKCKK